MATILIVEDNQVLAETLKDILLSNGHFCKLAFSLSSAKNQLQKNDIDIIILDFYLSDGTAIQLIKEIRQNKRSNLPIIGISAAHDDILKFKVLEAGANDQINKPFNAQELIFKVNNFASLIGKVNETTLNFQEKNNSLFENIVLDEIDRLIQTSNLSLTELAKRMRLSTSGLSKKIRRVTGKTYLEIVAEVKIENAKKLLAKGDKNISEVAESMGFKRVSHFSSFFKSFEGISPKKYELTKNTG